MYISTAKVNQCRNIMPYPWVQIIEGNPPSAAISLPAPIERSQRPSVISVVDDEPRPTDRQGVEVIRSRRHVIINKVSLQCNTFSQTPPHRAHGHEKYSVQCNSTNGVICRWSTLMSDVVCFVAKDISSARRLLDAWRLECRDLPPIYRPSVGVVVDDIGENCDPEGLACMFIDNQSNCCFRNIVVYRGEKARGKLPDDIFSQVQGVRDRRKKEKTLWDWHTLFRVSRGLLQQLARAPESAPGTKVDVSYVSAFDMSRLPQSLKEMSPWLEDAWGQWIQQATSVDNLRQTRLPILANALSVDTAAFYDGT
ncbi:hypothetical protein LZ30DRAFT_812726 [Colletotrichum cereale]|nr:hypothetical protein LZ30DRAFT_812726 [Colletotrichum cereale]